MRISKRLREKRRARRREKRSNMLRAIIATFAVILIGFGLYVGTFYRADNDAINEYMPSVYVEEETLSDGSLAYVPDGAVAGIIFYPGGRVAQKAYIPLMKALAAKGIATVLVKMPFNLAVFKVSAADGIAEQFPNVESWYMAGHSLGGAMAASYAEANADDVDGLILLAAYSAKDLSDTDLRVLSIYGSNDEILNVTKYNNRRKNLPEDFTEIVLEGANHAGFGMYGEQNGDGEATLSNVEQIELTADIIADFIFVDKA